VPSTPLLRLLASSASPLVSPHVVRQLRDSPAARAHVIAAAVPSGPSCGRASWPFHAMVATHQQDPRGVRSHRRLGHVRRSWHCPYAWLTRHCPELSRTDSQWPYGSAVLRHIQTWLRRYWWIGPLAILALAVIWEILWPLANALASRDVSGYAVASRAAHLQSAREAARTQLLTLGAGVFAAGALAFTALNFRLSRQQFEQSRRQFVDQLEQSRQQFAEQTELSRRQFTEQLELSRSAAQDSADAARRTLELTEQGQVTDRFTKAVEQLGSDKLDIRIGGIYGLERIAGDSARDHPTVMEVLSAFVRERCRIPSELGPADDLPGPLAADIQAALDVICRRRIERDSRQINLARVYCPEANLDYGSFAGVTFAGAYLRDSVFSNVQMERALFESAMLAQVRFFRVTLSHSILEHADLRGSKFSYADLIGAKLRDAKLSGARFFRSNLTSADLREADLSEVNLRRTNLSGAHLNDAKLTGADLAGANLSGAHLDGANLDGVHWPRGATPPEGWVAVADPDEEPSEGVLLEKYPFVLLRHSSD
jgi:uncharacterized protein YjbI with pentapeptide repeats